MARTNKKYVAKQKRIRRVRKKIFGTPEKPRMRVFRSLNHIYAQIIDDTNGVTMVATSTLEKSLKGETGSKVEKAQKVGEILAEKAKALGISQVVFDRGGNIYHGRVRALSEGARSGGLDF
ncbi:MAG: 50S ribosomal protein L18 [Thermodesulfobacteriota bacterium]